MLGAKKKKKVGGKRVFTSAKERMTEVNHIPFDKWEKVYDEVTAFKHDPKGRAAGRTVAMSDAVESFEQMLNLLNDSRAELAARY
jgi:hypothetical protein